MQRKHKKKKFKNKKKSRNFSFYLKKFLFWFITYFISITILTLLFENTTLYQAKIGFYLIMGFILVLTSRVVYSATKNKHFRSEGIIMWGFFYAIIFGLVDFILGKLPQIQINPTYDKYISILIFAIIFTIVLMFLRRMKVKSLRLGKKRIKTPSQIFTGIILVIAGILTFRFSYQIFVGWFNWAEGLTWSWLIGAGLIFSGVLVLIAWWRNNVLSAGKHFGLAIGKKHKI